MLQTRSALLFKVLPLFVHNPPTWPYAFFNAPTTYASIPQRSYLSLPQLVHKLLRRVLLIPLRIILRPPPQIRTRILERKLRVPV